MPSYMDLLNFGGGSFNDLSRLLQNQAGYIGGMGPDLSNMQSIFGQLQGFDPQNQFINMMQQFNPQVSGDIRERLTGIMQDPFQGQAGQTLNEMMRTGMPVDVSGLGQVTGQEMERRFGDLSGAMRGQAGVSGLSGTGLQNIMGRGLRDITEAGQRDVLRGEIGAAEAARGRQMGGIGQFLQGQGLAGQLGLGLGGLESQLSGQRLSALGQGGQMQQGLNAQTLQALLGAGGLGGQMAGLGLQGQQAQAGAGQNLISSLLPFAQMAGRQNERQSMMQSLTPRPTNKSFFQSVMERQAMKRGGLQNQMLMRDAQNPLWREQGMAGMQDAYKMKDVGRVSGARDEFERMQKLGQWGPASRQADWVNQLLAMLNPEAAGGYANILGGQAASLSAMR